MNAGLAKGIENSKNKVVDAVKGLSTDMSIGVKPAYASSGTDTQVSN